VLFINVSPCDVIGQHHGELSVMRDICLRNLPPFRLFANDY